MARPRKCRKVCSLPQSSQFGPLDTKQGQEDSITMTVDEYETIRLIDLEGLSQEECARQMKVARSTVQGIYRQARFNLAQALVRGKNLLIEGGDYRLCDDGGPACGKACPNHKRNKCRDKEEK